MQKKFVIALVMVIIAWSLIPAPALAVTEGVYSVSNTTSYTNPDTGRTDDGGSNLDIGEAMARSLTQSLMLYEVKDGKQYLTIRIGLSSYMRDMRVSLQTEKNKGTGYQPVPFEVVKENKETDTTEYRFEIESLDLRIMLTFFVNPMNRDVIFFITPDPTSVKSDQGAFAASDKAVSGYSAGFAGGLAGGNAEEGKMPALVEQLTGVSEVETNQTAEPQKQPEQHISSQDHLKLTEGSTALNSPPAIKEQSSADKQSSVQQPTSPMPSNSTEPPVSVPSISNLPGTDAPIAGPPAAMGESAEQQEPEETKQMSEQAEKATDEAVQNKEQVNIVANSEDNAQIIAAEIQSQQSPNPNESVVTAPLTVEGLEEKIPTGSTAGLADQGLTQFDSAGNMIAEPIDERSDKTVSVLSGVALIVIVMGSIGYFFYRRNRKSETSV